MFNISSLLKKLSTQVASSENEIKKMSGIVSKYTKLNILPEWLVVRNNMLYIDTSPSYKNKVFMYKESILKEINETSSIKIKDVR